MIKKALLTLILLISFSAQANLAYDIADEQLALPTELIEGEYAGLVDYEITIVEDVDDLFEWAQSLEALEEPLEFSSAEDLEIHQFIFDLMPEFKLMLTAPKAQRRTCSALGNSGTGKGMASWYGGKFHGRRTANGETYNQNGLTAAHKTLPFNSIIEVSYKGKSVRVRINDAGPYHGNRVIDLSKEAARQLGFINAGTGMVTLKIISCGKK